MKKETLIMIHKQGFAWIRNQQQLEWLLKDMGLGGKYRKKETARDVSYWVDATAEEETQLMAAVKKIAEQ